MVPYFGLILLIVWLPQAARQVLVWTYWWQVKEYRYDRFNLLFRSTDGRSDLDFAIVALKVALLAASIFVTELGILVLAAFLFLDFRTIYEIFSRRLRRPIFTQRALSILASGGFLVLIPILLVQFFPKINIYSSLFFGEIFLILGISMGICWTGIISQRAKKQKIAEAKRKLNQIRPFVIGVTGSYGKTTTKDFIAHLLSEKYQIVKTTGSQNTEFGIALNILENLKKGTKYFIAEMGAYKRGEVKVLADIVKPKMGVITGIEAQHLFLFGSLENIKKTKFELIEALPPNGTAVFNFSNPGCVELAQEAKNLPAKLKIKGYCLADNKSGDFKVDMESKVVSATQNGLYFEVSDGVQSKKFFAPLRGIHFLENLTGAILVARITGLSWKEIEKGCKTISLPEKTMQLKKLKNGSYIIDDSYNSTPAGFKSALAYLETFTRQKKAVITSGIIELGPVSKDVHKELGALMEGKIDRIILTNTDFLGDMSEGLGKDRKRLELVENVNLLRKSVGDLARKKFVILFEGRLPQSILDLTDNNE
ncbi:UDP-N-acetylmuramoyl-tripeptide--D-alanyl-D-alanine ligase [Patescibacteria group bacterium]|nr:UDP-N-acetylmuramoyl-tripeptide--D-alanyl-D-alanine ligase [Patescibacteria group bacterium]